MEAVEFLKEHARMCKSYRRCEGCPLENGACVVAYCGGGEARIVEAVEQWSAEHPEVQDEKA